MHELSLKMQFVTKNVMASKHGAIIKRPKNHLVRFYGAICPVIKITISPFDALNTPTLLKAFKKIIK
jgi:hypothetical protein